MQMPENVRCLECICCQRQTVDPMDWRCDCDPEARMSVVYVPGACERVAQRCGDRAWHMWRYAELLPMPAGAVPTPLHTGGTPLYPVPRLAASWGISSVWLKDEGRNPSASLKDRPSALAVSMAVASGQTRIICASTGNAASSTACQAASVGLAATIFVPQRAPEPKVAQLRVFGADVYRVQANYDRTWDLAAEVAEHKPWFNRNCAVNPYLVEGKKTVALEIAERLGDEMPEWIALSVGDGCTVAAVVRGLEEAVEAGFIASVPKVLAVQAEGAATLVHAAERGSFTPEPANTLADSIEVGHPRNPLKALNAVRRAGGAWIAVSDASILSAIGELGRLSGVFAEPAAAAVGAGVRLAIARGLIAPTEGVVLIVSGNGLKDTASALRAVGGPEDLEPTLEAALARLP